MSLFGVEDRLAGERLPGLLTPSTDSGRQTGVETDRLIGSDWLYWCYWLNWCRVKDSLYTWYFTHSHLVSCV